MNCNVFILNAVGRFACVSLFVDGTRRFSCSSPFMTDVSHYTLFSFSPCLSIVGLRAWNFWLSASLCYQSSFFVVSLFLITINEWNCSHFLRFSTFRFC